VDRVTEWVEAAAALHLNVDLFQRLRQRILGAHPISTGHPAQP
jgi:hypothetical protein